MIQNKYFHASFIHKNCSGQFLFSYFLFWDILNLNPTLAVCRKRESWHEMTDTQGSDPLGVGISENWYGIERRTASAQSMDFLNRYKILLLGV